MMSKFAVCARSAHDQESWIRSIPMLVLMFEGITGGVLDFDYAPASMLITIDGKSRRVWMNVTQEGKAAIDDLREKGLVNGLKLSTEDFQPVTAYQVSRKGLNLVGSCPEEIKAMVDKFLYPPPPAPQALLTVEFIAPEIIKVQTGKVLQLQPYGACSRRRRRARIAHCYAGRIRIRMDAVAQAAHTRTPYILGTCG
jgi:hypothetical protein